MTTNISLRPGSRRGVIYAIVEAYALGDSDVVVWDGVIATHADDWLTSVEVFGNYGTMVVARTGQVLMVDVTDSDDDGSDPHGGYHDIIHVEIDQWRKRWKLEWEDVKGQVDILMVAFHLEDGTRELAVNVPLEVR